MPTTQRTRNRTKRGATQEPQQKVPQETVTAAPVPFNQESLIEEIKREAYEIYLARGRTDGDGLLDWLEAERTVHFRRGQPN